MQWLVANEQPHEQPYEDEKFENNVSCVKRCAVAINLPLGESDLKILGVFLYWCIYMTDLIITYGFFQNSPGVFGGKISWVFHESHEIVCLAQSVWEPLLQHCVCKSLL
jgi:hypothetical protein